jgi:hypothetical protein
MQTSRGTVDFRRRVPAAKPAVAYAAPSRSSASATRAGSVSYRRAGRSCGVRRRWAALLAVAAIAGGDATPSAAGAAPRPVSSHAMVYSCCMPLGLQRRILDESRALKATYVRVDVEVGGAMASDRPNWSMLDPTLHLLHRPGPRPLGVLVSTPDNLASSCGRSPSNCPPSDPAAYAARVGQIVRHARRVISTWELVNEPCFFTGAEPDAYARLLRLVHRAMKRANPRARLVIGDPVAGCGSTRWLDRVLTLAPRSFEVANLHLRGSVAGVTRELRRYRAVYRRHGRGSAPLWVTEFGYPSATNCQSDPRFRGGARAQAGYLRAGLRSLTRAGASQVFVTLRDNLDGCWLSEGLENILDRSPFAVTRKPAFRAVRNWAGR